MRYVKVRFLSSMDDNSSAGYYYKDELSRKLKKYDTVIVPTRYGLSMAYVERVDVSESAVESTLNTSTMKSVAEKISSKSVDEVLKLKKVDELKSTLDKKIKEVDEVAKYKMYAELSPEIAELLKELEQLKS